MKFLNVNTHVLLVNLKLYVKLAKLLYTEKILLLVIAKVNIMMTIKNAKNVSKNVMNAQFKDVNIVNITVDLTHPNVSVFKVILKRNLEI